VAKMAGKKIREKIRRGRREKILMAGRKIRRGRRAKRYSETAGSNSVAPNNCVSSSSFCRAPLVPPYGTYHTLRASTRHRYPPATQNKTNHGRRRCRRRRPRRWRYHVDIPPPAPINYRGSICSNRGRSSPTAESWGRRSTATATGALLHENTAASHALLPAAECNWLCKDDIHAIPK